MHLLNKALDVIVHDKVTLNSLRPQAKPMLKALMASALLPRSTHLVQLLHNGV